MPGITLSAGLNTNLRSLSDTTDLLAIAQGRLSTGKKLNSALDNPLNFFTSKALSDRSTSISTILDGLNNGIQTLQAADKAANAINKALDSAKGVVNQYQAEAASAVNRATASSATLGNGGTAVTGSTLVTATAGGMTTAVVTGGTIILTPAGGTATTVTLGTLTATSTINDVLSQINTQAGAAGYNATVENGRISITSSGSAVVAVTGTAATALLGGATTNSAVTGGPTAARVNSLAAQFNEQVNSIAQLANDASFNGRNLLNALTSLTVSFNEIATGVQGSSSTTLTGRDVSLAALGLSNLAAAGATGTSFSAQLSALDTAKATVANYQTEFGNKLSLIQNRQTFAKDLVNVLDTGAGNLVNADTNLEAANILALQTRQQLSQQAISLSVQADQAVLRLFR
jgi:flagellin